VSSLIWTLKSKKNLKNLKTFSIKPRFFSKGRAGKVFFTRFKCPIKTGHKISTQEEHPIHNSLPFRAFSVKYNKTHK